MVYRMFLAGGAFERKSLQSVGNPSNSPSALQGRIVADSLRRLIPSKGASASCCVLNS